MGYIAPKLGKEKGVLGVLGNPKRDPGIGLCLVVITSNPKPDGHWEVIRVDNGFLGCSVSGGVVCAGCGAKECVGDGGDVGVWFYRCPIRLTVGDIKPIQPRGD